MGEFGYNIVNEHDDMLSEVASPVKMVAKYASLSHTESSIEAPAVFDRAQAGDQLAQQCINDMIHWLSVAAYNLITGLNPDRLLLGGGISVRDDVLTMVRQQVATLLQRHGAGAITTTIDRCQFRNESNLIGAIAQFLNEHPDTRH